MNSSFNSMGRDAIPHLLEEDNIPFDLIQQEPWDSSCLISNEQSMIFSDEFFNENAEVYHSISEQHYDNKSKVNSNTTIQDNVYITDRIEVGGTEKDIGSSIKPIFKIKKVYHKKDRRKQNKVSEYSTRGKLGSRLTAKVFNIVKTSDNLKITSNPVFNFIKYC